jgi:hypothetical protein
LLDRIESGYFDWLTWRIGTPLDIFGVKCRTYSLIANADKFRAAAVGWCPGDLTACRPKEGHKAVMYFVNGEHFWFHLRDHEFEAIFGRINDQGQL